MNEKKGYILNRKLIKSRFLSFLIIVSILLSQLTLTKCDLAYAIGGANIGESVLVTQRDTDIPFSIADSSSEQWFKFTPVDANTTYTITSNSNSSDFDSYAFLYESDRVQDAIAMGDDEDEGGSGFSSSRQLIQYKTYYLQIKANTTTAANGTFKITGGNLLDSVAVTSVTVAGASDATSIATAGGTLQMLATVQPSDATDPSVTWTVTETDGTTATSKATISASGLLTAVSNGTVRVKATSVSNGTVSGTKDITITNNPKAVTSVTVAGASDATSITTAGGTLQMLATVQPSDATDPSVTWTVTETDGTTATSKATISASGLLTAVSNGTVRVKATSVSNGTVSGTKDITITNNPKAVTSVTVAGASDATSIATAGGTLQMLATVQPSDATDPSVTWTVTETDGTTATSKATISASGLLTAVSNGTVRVKATSVSNGTVSGTKDITITNNPKAVTSIAVAGASDATSITTAGGTLQMLATVQPSDATDPSVTWTVTETDGTTATSKATISASGLLTAVSNGTVRVKATSVSNGTVSGTRDITIINNLTASSACDITTWTIPSTPSMSGLTASKTVPNGTTSLLVDVAVSANATWKLYNDAGCTAEIADRIMNLNVGANTAYIKVTAEDRTTTQIYTVTITRDTITTTAPTATTGVATSVTSTTATLNGTVNDNGSNTTVSFQYGVSDAYGSIANATPSTVNAGSGSTNVSATISGLTPNTDYHFRVRGLNSVGNTNGNDVTFTTSTAAPTTYTLTYTAGPNGTILGTSPQHIARATTGSAVTAIPNPGYHFANWSDNVTTATRIDRNVQNDITVTANFAVDTITPPPTPPTPPVPVPGKEEITVPVTDGQGNNTVSQTVIERTTQPDGTKKDDVTYVTSSAQETINKLKAEGKDTARVVVPDAKDEVSEAKVGVPKATITVLASGGVNLEIDTENARITVPKESVKDLGQSGTGQGNDDLYFRLVPIKEEKKQEEIKERAKQEEVVKQAAGNQNIEVVARPMTIETNMSQRTVDITLPLKGVTIPTESAQRAAFLNSLAVFIEHSDGTKELVVGEIVEYKPGMLGIKFTIHKFSTFTIIKMDKAAEPTATYTLNYTAAEGGSITGKLTQTINSTTKATAVTAVANSGYHFAGWSDGVSTATRLDSDVKANLSVTANFAVGETNPTPATYTLTYIAGAGGYIVGNLSQTVSGNTSGSAVKAVPYSGYYFRGWSDGVSTATRTDSNVKSNISVTATFYGSSTSGGGSSQGGSSSSSGGSSITDTNTSTPSETSKETAVNVNRLAGADRIDTALEIAKATFKDKIQSVVIATSENYPDALAGSVLAYKNNAPILLIGSRANDSERVIAYMKEKMDTNGTVFIIGGSAAISSAVEQKIKDSGFTNIKRINGVDRYETTAKISDSLEMKENSTVVLANGENFSDALSISSAAAANQYPILLVKQNEMPNTVKQKLSALKPSKIILVGMQGAIGEAVEQEASKVTSLDKSNIIRIGGSNRYETSLEIAKYFNLSGDNAAIATGSNFPDALAGSIYSAKNNMPLILTQDALTDDVKAYLKGKKVKGIVIFGGQAAVNKGMEVELTQLFK